jgi:NAD(P)-dependent dehydrogenase (short-subunit alcohol dehydrogenase family)
MDHASKQPRWALITGASRGLGKSIALALAGSGHNLALVGRDQILLAQTAEAVQQTGVRAEIFNADVSDEQQILLLKGQIASKCGGIDILINNAGINIRKPSVDFTLEEWNRVLSTNLTAPFLLCRTFVPEMKNRGFGRIINITSMMSHVSLPGRTAYCASKAGLLGFTRTLALELAPDKITVNGISPGPFATEMNQPILSDPEKNDFFISRIPLGRWGQVEEVGSLAVYLCSDAASFITGTDIVIDGGWTAQ